MARTVTVTFDDDTQHVYQNVPDAVTPDIIESRAASEFSGKKVKLLDGGKQAPAQPAPQLGNMASQVSNDVVPPAPLKAPTFGQRLYGGAEALTSLATAAPAAIVGNLTGAATRLTGGDMYQAEQAAADAAKRFTYQPREQIGKDVLGAVGSAVDASKLAGLNPATGIELAAASRPAIGALQQGVRAGEDARLAEKVAEQSRKSVKNTTLADAQAEGYVVPPSAAGGGFLTKRLESAGGKAAISQEASLRNQEVTNKIARREAGLAEDSPISEATLDAAREVMSGPYREVSAISPLAAAAFEKLKQARADAKLKYAEYERQKTVSSLREAEALDAKADMYENAIDKVASRAGKPDLIERVREARTNLAKNYDVERAINIGGGDVDAAVIGRMLDKRGLKGMTGGLATIGRFNQAYGPGLSREASKVQTPGISRVEAGLGAMLGIGGHLAFGEYGSLAALLPLLSGPARDLALSKLMKRGPPASPTVGNLSGLIDPSISSAIPVFQTGMLSQIQKELGK